MSTIKRDHYGLRLSFGSRTVACRMEGQTQEVYNKNKQRVEERNRLRTRLKEKTLQLRDALDRNNFISICLDRISHVISNTTQLDQIDQSFTTSQPTLVSLPEIEIDELFRLSLEMNEVERRLLQVQKQNRILFETLRRLNTYIITDAGGTAVPIPHSCQSQSFLPSNNTAKDSISILYRLHHDFKASHYDGELGLCCPGWRKQSAEDFAISKENFIKHLARKDDSSPPFISVTDSPGRVINFSKSDDNRGRHLKVLVINFRKLRTLGSRCDRTIDLARKLDVLRRARNSYEGVEFVTKSHWLIHRWVPKECIETAMGFDDFRRFCEKQGIIDR